MNPRQKKFIWIAGIAVAAVYFAPSFINSYRREAFIREQNAARLATAQAIKPPAAKTASPLPASGATPASAAAGTLPDSPAAPNASSQFDNVVGTWVGVGLLPAHGNCNLRLELRRTLEPGKFSGFPVLACMPMALATSRDGMLAQFSPASAVLSGSASNGAIGFSVDKMISKGQGKCAFTSFAVTPFGTDQIAVEWTEEESCPGGQMLLRRTGK
jgi:hypothetical protein